MKDALHRIHDAIGSTHVDADGAAGPHIQLADGVSKPIGTPPTVP
jgi:hypothetical protein